MYVGSSVVVGVVVVNIVVGTSRDKLYLDVLRYGRILGYLDVGDCEGICICHAAAAAATAAGTAVADGDGVMVMMLLKEQGWINILIHSRVHSVIWENWIHLEVYYIGDMKVGDYWNIFRQ